MPSHDIHPTEAMHGDLGRISPADVVLALSFSGETEELVTLASVLKQDGVPIISITGGTSGNGGGTLAGWRALPCTSARSPRRAISRWPRPARPRRRWLGDALR